MYNSKYYTCEQIDQRLLQGYYDDAVVAGYTGSKSQYLAELLKAINYAANPIITAKKVVYSKDISGLEAENVQEAIDRVGYKLSDLKGLVLLDGASSADRKVLANFKYFNLYNKDLGEIRIGTVYNSSSENITKRIIVRTATTSQSFDNVDEVNTENFSFAYDWDKHTNNINVEFPQAHIKVVYNPSSVIPKKVYNNSDNRNKQYLGYQMDSTIKTLLAFSCECYLKALLMSSGKSINDMKDLGHSLTVLFTSLDDETIGKVFSYMERNGYNISLQKVYETNDLTEKFMLDLAKNDDAFTDIRYSAENDKNTDYDFLYRFALSLRNSAEKELLQKSPFSNSIEENIHKK